MSYVSYLGGTSSFGYQATQKLFGPGANCIGHKTHDDIFLSVLSGESEFGVMAYENVDAGVVPETVRAINRQYFYDPSCQVKIVNEYSLPIELHLMGQKETYFENAKFIVSHDMALLQSNKKVEAILEKYPGLKTLKSNSTSEAAKMASNDKAVIALSSERSKFEFGLHYLEKNCENKQNNMTRFVVISTGGYTEQTGQDKTALALFLDRSMIGSLSKSLGVFEKYMINISIPYPVPHPKKNYEYIFVVELEEHFHNLRMQTALKELKKLGTYFQIYGTYPNRSTIYCKELNEVAK